MPASLRERRAPSTAPTPTSQRNVELPQPRGPLSTFVLRYLQGRPARVPMVDECDLFDDDLQLALHLCYELHYTGLAGVRTAVEWDPVLLAFRNVLEQLFLRGLIDVVGPARPSRDPRSMIRSLVDADAPSVSAHMADAGTMAQMRELIVHRSAYQLKEADPHTWAIPRLTGRAKRALATIQAGEYGVGDDDWSTHADLFAATMRALSIDARRNAQLERLPGTTLATGNLMSLFGLHREWRHALVGHLAVLEMTSVVPMARYANALERFGAPPEARRFYEVHVVADYEHERVALDEMVGGLIEDEPGCSGPLMFGVRAVLAVERAFAEHLLSSWRAGCSSLRGPDSLGGA